MNSLLLNIILILHFFVVCFVVFVPFFGSNYLLLMHSILIPFIIFHWLLNNNVCILSEIETRIRTSMNNGVPVDRNDCFTCRLIDPIYEFTSTNYSYSDIIYVVTIGLWLFGLFRLMRNYNAGEFSSLIGLFMGKQ